MDLIQCKILPDSQTVSYISLIRKFDRTLSIKDLKKKIENGAFALEFDLEYYDVVEDLNEIDRKMVFRELLEQLLHTGAKVELYHNGEKITLTLLDNWLKTIELISAQSEEHINKECDE
ncbi:hypothetical protein [Clostridium merdae]|uniref:hypothetical protein n=1 Tax=Clostridium merdae TaxID=1958780 RepID=UPI000A26EE92|nr:hypothetical protein [Clostridium merdae]